MKRPRWDDWKEPLIAGVFTGAVGSWLNALTDESTLMIVWLSLTALAGGAAARYLWRLP